MIKLINHPDILKLLGMMRIELEDLESDPQLMSQVRVSKGGYKAVPQNVRNVRNIIYSYGTKGCHRTIIGLLRISQAYTAL